MSFIPLSSYFNPLSQYHHGFEHLKSTELSWGSKILAIILGSLLTVGVVTYPLGLYVFRKLTKSTEKLGAQADKVDKKADSILNPSKKTPNIPTQNIQSEKEPNEPKRTGMMDIEQVEVAYSKPTKVKHDLPKSNSTKNGSPDEKQSLQKEISPTLLDESFLNGISEYKKNRYISLVRPLISERNYEQVRKILGNDIGLHGISQAVYKEIGLLCFREENYAVTIEFFENLYEENRESLFKECATACLKDGKYNESLTFIERIYGDNRVSLYKEFATSCFNEEKYDGSIKFLSRIAESISIPMCEKFAKSCCKAGKYDDSIKFIKIISYQEKIKEEIFLAVAEEHYRDGNLEKALETVNQLKRLGDDQINFYLKIGDAYMQQGKLDEAADTAKIIIGINKEKDQLLTALAKKYYEKGDLENAASFNESNPNFEDAKRFYIRIAEDFQKQDKHTEALEVLEKIANHGYLVSDARWVSDTIKDKNFNLAINIITGSPLKRTYRNYGFF